MTTISSNEPQNEDVLSGAPGGEEVKPAPVTPESLVGVKVNGKEFEVPSELADALSEQSRDISRKFGQLGSELDETRSKVEQLSVAQPAEANNPADDFDERFFSNPKEVLNQYASNMREEIIKEVKTEQNRDNGLKDFWDGFYRDHDDLKDDRMMVEAVLNRDFKELGNMLPTEAANELSSRTYKEIARMTKRAGNTKPEQVIVEGAGQTPQAPQEQTQESTMSLGDVIRQRRKQRIG